MSVAQPRQLPRVVAEFDKEKFLAGFSARRHIVQSLIICAVLGAGAGWLARSAQPIDWLFLPGFWLFGNFVEWAFHKGPMHRPARGKSARVLYFNHTMVHHRAFLHDDMPIEETRDLGLILMPWYTLLLLMVLGSPAALAAGAWRGVGVIGIFYLFALGYYLSYEVLHGMYHAPEAMLRRYGFLANPIFRFLRNHHAHHHRLDRMSRANFNVTLPVADFVMGTREKPVLDADAAATATTWEDGMSDDERAVRAQG